MRAIAIALALLVPLPALASYVIHPAPGDPNPPIIVAQWGVTYYGGLVLDRYGHVWERWSDIDWRRVPEDDPPIPVDQILFWEKDGLVATSGDLWRRLGEWENLGLPPISADVAAPVSDLGRELRSMPNPSAGSTRIAFSLPTAGPVTVCVLGVSGRLVRTLLEGDLPAGPVSLTWDGRNDAGEQLPAGVYFSRVETAQGTSAGRVVLARH